MSQSTDNPDINSELAQKILRETLKPAHMTDPTVLRFISHFLHCRSHSQAAKLCGLTAVDGRNLYARPDIYNAISKLTAEAVVKFGYDAAEVVERVKEIAFFDPVDLVYSNGTYKKNLKDIPPETRRVIKKLVVKNVYEEDLNGVPQYKGEIITYEFWDKNRSLELLGREKDTFKKTNVIVHDVSKNARSFLLDSVRRADNAVAAIDVTPSSQPTPELDVSPVTPIGFTKPPGVR